MRISPRSAVAISSLVLISGGVAAFSWAAVPIVLGALLWIDCSLWSLRK